MNEHNFLTYSKIQFTCIVSKVVLVKCFVCYIVEKIKESKLIIYFYPALYGS